MTEYTPTTKEVRINYIGTTAELAADVPWREHRPAEFDRWIEEHDRQVAEESYDEGFANGVDYHADTIYAPLNPYRHRKAVS